MLSRPRHFCIGRLRIGRLPFGRRRLAHLAKDQRGVAAVEFALIAPLMILLYFGLSELAMGILAARHTNHASSSLGDLAAQCASVNDTDLANMFGAANDIMAPLQIATLKVRVSSIVVSDGAGDTTVAWSRIPSLQTGVLPLAQNSAYTLPTGLVSGQGDSVIMAEATYGFMFPIDLFNGILHFNDVTYFKPRKTTQVAYTGSTANGGTGTGVSCYAS